jgi:hypothetical protein
MLWIQKGENGPNPKKKKEKERRNDMFGIVRCFSWRKLHLELENPA